MSGSVRFDATSGRFQIRAVLCFA